VDLHEREVPVDEPDLPGIRRVELLEGGGRARAVGALEIRELDDGDGRIGRTARGIVADGQGQARRLQHHVNVRLRAQAAQELGLALAEPLLPQTRFDPLEGVRLRHLAHAGLVLRVEGLLLLFRHGSDLGFDLLLEELGRGDLPRRRLAIEEPLGDLVVEDLALGLVLLGPELEQARARRLFELARGERLSGDRRHDVGGRDRRRLRRRRERHGPCGHENGESERADHHASWDPPR
jgi:hypothetical protein